MSVGIVFGLVAIAAGFTLCPLVAAKRSMPGAWIEVAVPEPPSPSSMADDHNITYVHDENGNISGMDFDDVEDEPIPFFSVENDVRFELFTYKNPTEPQILIHNNQTSVKLSNFSWKRPTRILIHGWNSEGLLTPRFADAYLVKGNHRVNFIAVNWQKGSDIYNYYNARQRVQEMAEHVARFIDFMAETAGLRLDRLTIVGHSLGAHISGIAGKMITKGKVDRIVGLDPAKPFFSFENETERLAETDASYVEVIHTCTRIVGFAQPLGTASFYPNGGSSQPGCGINLACAHGRAYEFYIESIVTPQFYAFQCESFENLQKGNCSVVNQVVQMGGEPGTKKGKGVYYLQTNKEPMYSLGKRGILRAVLTAKKKSSFRKFILNLLFSDPAHADITSDEIREHEENGILQSMYMDASSEENRMDDSSEEEKTHSSKSFASYLKDLLHKKGVNDKSNEKKENSIEKEIAMNSSIEEKIDVKTNESSEEEKMNESREEEKMDESPEEENDKDDNDEKAKKSFLSYFTNLFRKKPVNASKEGKKIQRQ